MPTLTVATLSDKGRQRDNNEDRVWAQVFSPSEGEPVGLLIVCDGVGGSLGGEVASHWAVETIKRELADLFAPVDPMATVKLSPAQLERAITGTQATLRLEESQLERRLRSAIQRANEVILTYARHNPEEAANSGSTLCLALVQGTRAIVANVGDSRAYLLRAGQLQQISQDHSLVAGLVAAGHLRPDEVYSHPQRNVILRSMGQKDGVQADLFKVFLQPGDTLLLCSDGLWEMVRDARFITRTVQNARDLPEACRRLVDAANHAGGDDNISVVLGRLSD